MGAGFKISTMISFLKSLFRKNDNHRPDLDKAEVRRLEKALHKWVEERRYREYCISREEIAAQLNTSRSFLNRYFTQILKEDFNTWRTRLRVEDAKKVLIDNRELPINIVGEMVGFSDRSNFHRQFTRIVGCSPKQWRDGL
jgi:AraC-like DNA-binding protein